MSSLASVSVLPIGEVGPEAPNAPKVAVFGRKTIQAWMQYMEDYGQAWQDDTGREFYSQEYWYLVTMTLVCHWRRKPLNVSDAYRSMKTGSSKTRQNRLGKIIAEHWCIKVKDQTDLRRTYLKPTEEMLLLGREHFRSSLGGAVRLLAEQRLLKQNPTPLLGEIEGSSQNLDRPYLLPWAEFLIGYTDDWNQTFGNRFRTDEYWLPFVRCLRGGWSNQPLIMGEACQCMSTGSSRTREKRIAFAVSRGMLKRQRGGPDQRVTSILATSTLESRLLAHFARTWSGPLNSDKSLLGRVSLAYIAHDGYNRNSFAGAADATDGDKDTFAWRAQLHYEPNGDLSIRLSMDRSINDPDRSITPVRVTQGPILVAATASFQPTSPFEVAADFNDLERLEAEGAALVLDYRLSESVGLKSITSFRQLDHVTHIDLDGTGFEIFGVHVDQNQEQFSQELQVSYDSGGSVRALLGAYYFSEDDISPDGISNSEPINFGVFFSPYQTVSENHQSVQATAVFGEVSWFLTPNLEFTAGLRYTDESKRLRRKACQNLAILGTVLPSIEECNPPADSSNPFALNLDLDKNFNKFTPKLALSYSSERMGLTYFTYARGFKSGGFDGRIGYNGASDGDAVATQAEPYDPEVADTYEVGWKAGLLDGRLRLGTALFYNDYQDLQLSSFSATPEGGFATVFTNAGKAETYGLEAELLASPTQNLLLSLSLGYLKAEYREFINSQMQDVSDQLMPINSPEFSGNLGFQYRHPLGFAWLELGADLSYRSAYYVDINNLSALKQSDYVLLNTSIGLEDNQGKWGLSFGVKNLTDESYITHGFDLTAFPGIGLAYYGEPLTYRFGIRYRFM